MYVCFKPTQTNDTTSSLTNPHSRAQHTQPTTHAAHQKTPTMIPPSCQLPAASILMVSVIALPHVVVHNLRNTATLIFFYEINSSLILFTIILFVTDWRARCQKVYFCSEQTCILIIHCMNQHDVTPSVRRYIFCQCHPSPHHVLA